jgi:YD repeat-containing protein
VPKYGYDQAGNMTSRPDTTLAWDAENRLASVNQDGRVTTFVYDADGRRVKKETPWGTTYYIGEHYERYVPAAGLSILPGDVNADCVVRANDIQAIAARWGQAWSAQYDVDQDGSAIDAGDIQTTAANWRASVPTRAPMSRWSSSTTGSVGGWWRSHTYYTRRFTVNDETRLRELVQTISHYAQIYHQGTVELVSYDGQNVRVHLGGACEGCPMAPATLRLVVERTIRDLFPEVKSVEAV